MKLKDITLNQYQQIVTAIDMHQDNEIGQWCAILNILEGESTDYYRKLKYTEFVSKIKPYENLLTDELPEEWVKEFTINNETFYVTQFATDWTAEQFISMSTLTKDKTQIVNNLNQILATLTYKDKGEIIDLTEFKRRSDLFAELPILTAYPIGFFFAVCLMKLSQTTPYYLHLKKKMEKLKKMKNTN